MANKTELDVITKALQVLTVVASGETPTAEDRREASDVYRAFHNVLASNYTRTMSWNYDSVPEEVYAWVAHLLAFELIGTFSASQEVQQRVDQLAAKAERNFRQYMTGKPRRIVELPIV